MSLIVQRKVYYFDYLAKVRSFIKYTESTRLVSASKSLSFNYEQITWEYGIPSQPIQQSLFVTTMNCKSLSWPLRLPIKGKPLPIHSHLYNTYLNIFSQTSTSIISHKHRIQVLVTPKRRDYQLQTFSHSPITQNQPCTPLTSSSSL